MRHTRSLLALVLSFGALVLLPAAGPTQAGAAVQRKPNIVLVMMDDMRWDDLRYAPNVRRYITTRGISFSNSFSPLPLCCPARASFLLGKLAHNHGVMRVDRPYGFGSFDDRRTLAGSLRASGYDTALVGKYLNGYGRHRSLVTGRDSLRYRPAGWTDWMASVEKRWPKRSKYRGGTYNYRAFTQNINGRVVANRGRYSSTVIGTEAVGLVRKYHRRARPFFLWLTPVAPHHGGPGEKRDPRDFRKANGFVQQFPTPYTPKWVRGRFDRAISHAPGVPVSHPAEPDISDKRAGYRRFLENTRAEKLRLRAVARQRAESIYAWDREFGRVVAALRATGEYRSTVLMFTSDNGYYLGEHRHPAGKIEHHEVSSRVPLVVAGPGIARGVRHYPAMTHDLTATVLDLARARPLAGMDGVSLRPVLTGADRAWDRPVLLEAQLNVARRVPFPPRVTEFGVRTGRYKYVRFANGEEELYDLAADPNELRGLQRDPGARDLKARLGTVWERYAGCRGPQCSAPLDEDLQVDVPTLAAQAATARQQWNAYYNR